MIRFLNCKYYTLNLQTINSTNIKNVNISLFRQDYQHNIHLAILNNNECHKN